VYNRLLWQTVSRSPLVRRVVAWPCLIRRRCGPIGFTISLLLLQIAEES
jgi:hypothetical protein